MAILKRIFLVTIITICISFSFCYAIDENQLSSGTTQQSTSSIDTVMSINTDGNTISNQNNNSEIQNGITASSINETSNVNSNSSIETSSASNYSTSETKPSTTVSNVSSTSNSSTISNILNIALIVVGLLLIFLAIAILIRLNS